jgi:hypothetical protein
MRRTEEAPAHMEMTAREAERIINEYGAVIEKTAPLVYGASETSLPFGKDIIKRAIRVTLISLKTDPKTCRGDLAQTVELLKIAYIFLADFIPLEDAKIGAAVNAVLLSGDPHQIVEQQDLCERWQKISRENLARRVALAEEFRQFLQDIPSDAGA